MAPGGYGLTIDISSDRLVLTPAGCRLVVVTLDAAARLSGVRPTSAAVALRSECDRVAQRLESGHRDMPGSASLRGPESGSGHRDLPEVASGAGSECGWINTSAAAERLGFTSRHTNRLAAAGVLGEVRTVGNRHLVHADAVDAFLLDRTLTERTPA